ncbi:hypothetical protein TRFO_07765 [Tritrichomonas foetus]|uniref:AIR9-like A9 domain-containing protein n=1 Tax=Tritrichomonas foetus TaxID=1144522 RepID=A0A1J4JPV2_9EUKA|nr:hypothetical protein TRFO_07765 [Tritrichomonas foetus]|eukprot:OHT00786.1 hypothetical protein TRFO_07765 [Tritrichomonas foetus]
MQRTPTRTPTRTPVRTPTRTVSFTPKKNSQITSDLNSSVLPDSNLNSFTEINSKKHARVLHLQQSGITSFGGLHNFPNVRCIELQDNPVSFSIPAVLVAFRSLGIKNINGEDITQDDHISAFNYSGIVTYALRQGMKPTINEDPNIALRDSLRFLERNCPELKSHPDHEPLYTINDQTVTLNVKCDHCAWYMLDDEFYWRPLNLNSQSITSSRNYPLKCEVKNAIIKNDTVTIPVKSLPIYIPEFDNKYHVFAEIQGDCAEGRIISVKAPLSAQIEWRHLDDESLINSETLVLPLTPDDVGRIIACDITPGEGLPKTRVLTTPVKPGEFRFRSLRLQGELVEQDEIEFEVSTKGTRAKFIGIRILRSARHGDWEHIDFISAEQNNSNTANTTQNTSGIQNANSEENDQNNSNLNAQENASVTPANQNSGKLKYRLTVHDIGCVIRAVCITEGGGPPLMLTSNERVQPSPPHFTNANIYGSLSVGMPLFAVAHYEGGLQGNCRYEWSIGGKASIRPVVVPTSEDIGKSVSCKMTPIRNDGSIGQTVEASLPNPIKDGHALQERFLEYKKKTRSGRLQMSFVDKRPSDSLFVIREGETIIISTPCDWAVVTQFGICQAGHSKMFTADADSIKGIVVVFTEDFFAIAGQIEASNPTASNIQILCDNTSAFLTVDYRYSGGQEGRSIIQWNRNDGIRETVVGFGKSIHVGLADRGCTYKVIVTPQSLDGKCGTPSSSDPYLIDEKSVISEEKPKIELKAPETTLENAEIKIVTQGDPTPDRNKISYVELSEKLTKRNRIYWTCDNKVIAEGYSFTPTEKFVDKIITVEIHDHLRNIVLADLDLPKVTPQTASVSNVRLIITPLGDGNQLVTVERTFFGGIEGESQIVWKIFEKEPYDQYLMAKEKLNQQQENENDKENQEIKEPEPVVEQATTSRTITVDESVEGYYIHVDYYPKNRTQNQFGNPVSSEMVPIPIIHPPVISIVDAAIYPNREYTELICKVATEGEGKILYEWGYLINEAKHPTGEKSNRHTLVPEDFEHPLYCHLMPISPTGKYGDDAMVYPEPTVMNLFTPTIVNATIIPKVKQNETQLMKTTSKLQQQQQNDGQIILGQEIEVSINGYNGPPFNTRYVIWERSEEAKSEVQSKEKTKGKGKNKADDKSEDNVENNHEEEKWKNISEEETYIVSSADVGFRIRARIEVSATHDLLEEAVFSETFITPEVIVSRNNPTIIRMASALYRTKKAMFDAKLSMGEKVTIHLENGMFLMKGGASVLLRAQYGSVHVEVIEGTTDAIRLRARHGYNTELTFGEKKMNGGMKFMAPQTRELFIETLNLFKQ